MPKDPQGLFNPQRPSKQLLMRHPQTIANIEARYQGQQNAALSELGEAQRKRAVAGLLSWEPDVVVTSPLDRCRSIAEPVAEGLGIELIVDDRLMEMSFGLLEGLTYDQITERGLAFPWDASTGAWPVEGAETIAQFAARVQSAADDLILHEGRVASVVHGGVVRGITSYWMQIADEGFWLMAVRNVESACFSADGFGSIFLEGFGLHPEWLASFK
ncbi:MAG: histidine phosphatase family protein [Coriobacteriia bacterium]|nr:histidine phosphatase family protein [Coriobacteriia bacterium]